MERALGPVGSVTPMRGAILIEVSRPQSERAAQIGSMKVGSELVTLEVVRKRMSPGEIFDYLQDELRTREESMVLMGGLDRVRPQRQAHAISSSPGDKVLKEGSGSNGSSPSELRPGGDSTKGGGKNYGGRGGGKSQGGQDRGKSGKGKGGKSGKGKTKGKGKGDHGKGGRGPPERDAQ